jgi:hypothetical protein
MGADRNGVLQTRIVDRDRDKLQELLDWLGEHHKILVTYNGDHFDIPVIRAILANYDPYSFGHKIISEGSPSVALSSLPSLPCDHIDLAARLRRGRAIPSLKKVAAYQGRPTLQELPYAPGSILSDEQWTRVKEYNLVDLANTRGFLERVAPDLEALAALSEEQRQDLRSTPTPQVVERIFLRAFKAEHGASPVKPQPPHEVVYRPVVGVRRPSTPEAAAWHDLVANVPIPMVGPGDRRKPDVPRSRFAIGNLMVSVGSGGLHSADKPRVYYSTRRHELVSVDVASFYPSLIAAKGIAPRAYGSTGTAVYRGIIARRLETKRLSKTAADPDERKRLDVQATGLKLVTNSYFGKTGDPYSTLYDPAAFLAVTLSGQLMLLNLIERLTAANVRVLSANTDGLFLKVRRNSKRWRKILARWQRDTAMTLEVERLKRLVILASNRFATLDRSGKVKRRGSGVKGDLSPLAAPNNLVVADAVVEALLHDVPPERTVRACSDPIRYCNVTQRSGKVTAAVLVDETAGTELELPKVCRWYHARNSSRKIAHRFADGRHTTPAGAKGINLALDLSDGLLPEDLDRGWYIGQARKVVQSVPGYRHRSVRRLQDHPAPLELVGHGLVPVPKWAGKAQPRGSDRSRPTYLWDWASYTTFGTYTGPLVAILVVDVDDEGKFRIWVDRGNSPLLADRWRDLDGCLVSCHGDATPEAVRTGRARGKLIFRLEADGEHPLAKMKKDHWLKAHGVEVFYGHGTPSVLGEHPDGSRYRLDGAFGEPPDWLIDLLTPKRRLKEPGATPRPRPSPSTNGSHRRELTDPAQEDSTWTMTVGTAKPGKHAHHKEPSAQVEVDPALLEGLPKVLAELASELGQGSVGWREKELGDGRTIYVGRCPYEHASGTSTDGDLATGYAPDGNPYVRCMHASCTEIPAIDKRLKETVRPATAPAAEVPPLEPTAIAESLVRDLEDHLVAFHRSPTGSGKSYSNIQAAILRFRADQGTVLAVPTLILAREALERLETLAPDADATGAIAPIFGFQPITLDGHAERGDGADEDDGDPGEYPIHPWTRIIILTHAQLLRRGFSKFIRGIWPKLERDDDAEGRERRPAFSLIIDEADGLVRACRWEIPLAHRVTLRREPDRSCSRLVPLLDCPMSNRSGNCGNCTLVTQGGEPRFNKYKIRELRPPQQVTIDAEGNRLGKPFRPLEVTNDDLTLGPRIRVGDTTFAAQVLNWQGKPIDAATRRTASHYLYQKDEHDEPPQELPLEVLGHMLECAYRPVVTWERPLDEEGNPVDPDLLKFRIEHPGKRDWATGIVFPWQTCNAPRLRLTDLVGLDKMRQFAAEQKVGITFTGATLTSDDEAVLREIWPRMVERKHPYPDRKIRQTAIVFLDDHHGITAIEENNRLVTAPLEPLGLGLVFCTTKRIARSLYVAVRDTHPSVRFVEENDEVYYVRRSVQQDAPLGCYVTYSRGVLGIGANIENVRFLVVDARAFRPLASFTPGAISPAEFERARAEERLVLLLQNVGRALRGEAGKTVVLIVLNADEPLRAVLSTAPAIVEGSELPPVIATGKSLPRLVDEARRWLEAGGGDWPQADLALDPKSKRPGRPKGKTSRTKDSVLKAAEEAIKAGVKWREFTRRQHPERMLTPEEIDTLKARFVGGPS